MLMTFCKLMAVRLADLVKERDELLKERTMLLETIEKTMEEQGKVKLPSDVARALMFLESTRSLETIILDSFLTEQSDEAGEIVRDFAADNFKTLLAALVNGYTIEETIQDRIKRGVQEIYVQWTTIPSLNSEEADGADLAERISNYVASELKL